MAIDTAARRFSMMDFDLPMQPGMTPPDNAIVAADRSSFLWLYEGIALAAAVASGTRRQRQIKSLIRTKRRGRRCRWLPRGIGNGNPRQPQNLF